MISANRLLLLLVSAAALAGCAPNPSTYEFGRTAQNGVWQHGSLLAPNLP